MTWRGGLYMQPLHAPGHASAHPPANIAPLPSHACPGAVAVSQHHPTNASFHSASPQVAQGMTAAMRECSSHGTRFVTSVGDNIYNALHSVDDPAFDRHWRNVYNDSAFADVPWSGLRRAHPPPPPSLPHIRKPSPHLYSCIPNKVHGAGQP